MILLRCRVLSQDYAPNVLRRRVLRGEYSGDALERRLALKIGGGWRMLAALWRMSSVNLHPALAAGTAVPGALRVTPLRLLAAPEDEAETSDEPVSLAQVVAAMAAGGRGCGGGDPLPLVLNFGSCT